jgi:flagellar motor switch protein FliG
VALQKLETLEIRQQSLLLTLLLFGSREFDSLLTHLPDDVVQKFKEQAANLSQVERSKRIQLLVAQLKRLLTYQSQSSLLNIEPSWLAQVLKKEAPAMVEAILASLPAQLARQIVQRLGSDAPTLEALPTLDAGVKNILQRSFEGNFAPMPYEEFSVELDFRHLLLLRPKDLIILAREFGKNQIALAFSSLGMQATAGFLSHFNQTIQDDIIAAVKDVGVNGSLEAAEAKALLSASFSSFHNVEDLFQKSGLYTLAVALGDKEALLLKQIAQRLPFAHGQTLIEYAKFRIQNQLVYADIKGLQNKILSTLIALSQSKQIDERFAQCLITASST